MEENSEKINRFALSRRIHEKFREWDRKGQADKGVDAVKISRSHLPRYGECWNVLVNGLYQQGKFTEAAIEAATGNFRDATSWTRTIDQTLQQNVGREAHEKISKASRFLLEENKTRGKVNEGPYKTFNTLHDPNKEEEVLNPLERKRIHILKRATDQMYLQQISQDVEFIEHLLKDKKLDIKDKRSPQHTKEANKKVHLVLKDTLKKCDSWKWQMHQRTPLYYHQAQRFLTTNAKMRATDIHQKQLQVMNRVKAKRIAAKMMTKVNETPRKLQKYIEDVVYPFYSGIPEKSFPDMGEFVENVLEAAGQAYIRNLIEEEIAGGKNADMYHLLRIPTKPSKVTNLLDFTYKTRIKKLENLLLFARHPLERAIITYHIYKIMIMKLPEYLPQAKKQIHNLTDASKEAGSPSWCFLSSMASANLEYVQLNYQKTEIHLLEALEIIEMFPNIFTEKSKKILRHCHRNLLREMISKCSGV